MNLISIHFTKQKEVQMIYYEDYINFENSAYEILNFSKEYGTPTTKMYSCRKNNAIINALKSCIIIIVPRRTVDIPLFVFIAAMMPVYRVDSGIEVAI